MGRPRAAARRTGKAAGPAAERFRRRVFGHLLALAVAFVAAEAALFRSGVADPIAAALGAVPWPMVLGVYIVVGWLASRWAHRLRSPAAQYAALALYLAVKVVIFVPLLDHAERFAPGSLEAAAWLTVAGFAALCWIGLHTGVDLSFLRSLLVWGGFAALLLILSAWLYGWRLGSWFPVGMIALAGASVLYDSQRLGRARGGRAPAAALRLFAAIAMMFWYSLRLARRLRSGAG